jgi:chorismate dehydratase
MQQKPYSISIVNYFNTLPFVYGIDQANLNDKIDLHFDIPSVCADKLIQQKADIGLIPVAALTQLDNYHIITNFCIGSNGPVDSVKLFSNNPLDKIKTILLDYQSRTSVKLVQVLCKEWWKINPEFINAEKGFEDKIDGTTAAVIIGDRTFSIKGKFLFEYDLSVEWKKLTGLPFAFAVWVSTKKIEDRAFLKEFDAALKNGVEHIEEALLTKNISVENFDSLDYLKNKISYPLDSEKLRAIDLFINKITTL